MSTNTKEAQGEIKQNIFTLFNIEALPEDKQEETINRIGKIIFQGVLLRVLPRLTEEELAEYEKLVEEGVQPEVLFDFFFAKVPSFLQIVAEESENFKKDSEQVLSQIK